ncbi:hypothetical protein G4B88_012643 [Cannabis sativa]|uniref:RNase H type-1 domain-containing protein n=1 Tax=Cannabis sativa TaxID=3483 RepID=A0A7J6H110_CANSA|nr:hypothetical protein G4B88_012643 [Cannabis sativa]
MHRYWFVVPDSQFLLSDDSRLPLPAVKRWFRRQSSLRGDFSSPDTLRATPSSPHKKNSFQLSNSTPFEEFFPRLHPTSDAQDLQQAVDQFLHVDSPQSSPNPRLSTQSPQLVSSPSTRSASYTANTHAMPSFSVRPSAPIITDSISVSTNIDKGKGKAPMFAPTTNPSRSRGESGLVINASCPPLTAAIPSIVRPTFMRQLVNREKSSILFSPNTSAEAQFRFRQDLHLVGEGFINAAIDHHNGLTGAGFVFKRGYQTVLASQYRRLPGVVSPIFSEGQALLQSLKWCIDSQFSPQVVFSDCLNLVSKVNGDWQDNSALSGLIFPQPSSHSLLIDTYIPLQPIRSSSSS